MSAADCYPEVLFWKGRAADETTRAEAAEAEADVLADALDVAESTAEIVVAENERLRERAEVAEAELRVREASQIPMIPRAAMKRLTAAEAQRDALAEALRWIGQQQPKTLAMLRKRGVVFNHAPKANPDDNFELVAFWIYTDLCEVDSVAREALAGVAPPEREYLYGNPAPTVNPHGEPFVQQAGVAPPEEPKP